MRLIESTMRVQVRPGWTLGSAFVHGSLIGMTIVMTMRVPARPPTLPEPVTLVYPGDLAPRPSSPAPDAGIRVPGDRAIRLPSIALPKIPGVDVDLTPHLGVGVADPGEMPGAGTGAAPGGGAGDATIRGGLDAGAIHASSQVDRAVMPRRTNPRPEYPASLRAAAAEGEVLVRFVVDTAGTVEAGSVVIVAATHPLFADAVRRWVPRTSYLPAEAAGRRVRQLVQQRVTFDLVR